MKIGILFFSDTYFMQDSNKLMGRFVANDQFLTALDQQGHTVYLYVSSQQEKEYLDNRFLNKFNHVEVVTIVQLYNQSDRFLPDVLHIQSPNLYRCFYLRDKIFKKCIPVTGITHSLGFDPFLDWVVLNLIHKPKAYDALVCTSPTARMVVENFQIRVLNKCETESRLKTKVIPLGIEKSDVVVNTSKTDLRNKYGFSNSDFCLVWFGRFSHATKTDLGAVISNLRALTQTHPDLNVRFIAVGSLESEHELFWLKDFAKEMQMNEQISYFTNVDQQQKSELLKLSDVFLAPSDNIQETFGLCLLEALEAGLPVIAHDWDGFKSILSEDCAFFLPTYQIQGPHFIDTTAPLGLDSQNHFWLSQATIGDYKTLSESVKRLITDKALLEKMSQAAKLRALEFSWNVIIPKYVDLWTELLSKVPVNAITESGPVLDYRQDFSSYPSGFLTDNSVVKTTQHAESLLKGEFGIKLHAEMESLFSTSLIQELLMNAIQAKSIGELRKSCLDDESLITIHLSWLLKYGFLELIH